MRLIVQDVPPSLNKVVRMHWRKQRALRDVWIWMIRAAFGQKAQPRPVKRKVWIVLWHSRMYDRDNAYGACKVIFDAMKAENLIVDDSDEWLDANVKQEKCPHKERHTVIEMEEG